MTFQIAEQRLAFSCDTPEIAEFLEGYDPRVVPLDGCYYVIWCNNYQGYTIGLGWTEDFQRFHQPRAASPPTTARRTPAPGSPSARSMNCSNF